MVVDPALQGQGTLASPARWPGPTAQVCLGSGHCQLPRAGCLWQAARPRPCLELGHSRRGSCQAQVVHRTCRGVAGGTGEAMAPRAWANGAPAGCRTAAWLPRAGSSSCLVWLGQVGSPTQCSSEAARAGSAATRAPQSRLLARRLRPASQLTGPSPTLLRPRSWSRSLHGQPASGGAQLVRPSRDGCPRQHVHLCRLSLTTKDQTRQ